MNFLVDNWGFVSKGLWMTLRLAGVVMLFTTLISILLGVLATLKNRPLRWSIHAYVELFRSIPLIVNVFFIFFGAPLLGLDLSPFAAVTTGLTLWGSANGIEIVRGGLESVARHQWKSAWALGLRPWQIYLYVIAPQSMRAILPAYTGLLTMLVQATSLGALVGVGEFLKVGQIHGHDRRQPRIRRLWGGPAGVLRHLFTAELAQPLSRTSPGPPGDASH
jgi:polar amino acid transport system permease protein